MSNAGLREANKAKKDEFYTQLSDIEAELKYYKEYFKGKTVFCNADDPYESNFFKHFAINFNSLGLKKLIATNYVGSPITYTELPLFQAMSKKRPYCATISELTNKKQGDILSLEDIKLVLKKLETEGKINVLQGDGDFRSSEAVACLMEADVVVTNPPFSLFREFVAQLIEYNKDFIILGNVNAVSYKEVFELFAKGQIWLGKSIHSGDREFRVPADYPLDAAGCRTDEEGNRYIRVKGVRWFTNVEYDDRHTDIALTKTYSPEFFQKYDNYDAINVDKTSDIPFDYYGAMGVPITFLDKYNPDQFEIIGAMTSTQITDYNFGYPYVGGKKKYARIIIRRK